MYHSVIRCLFLAFMARIFSINCEETKNVTLAVYDNKTSDAQFSKANESVPFGKNLTIEMERIIQPSNAQTQQIERTSYPETVNISATIAPHQNSQINHGDRRNKSDFRPSPHLETYYEFNKFPVPPAFPEAKHIQRDFGFSHDQQQPVQWPDKFTPTTSEQPWTSRIKFPAPSVQTSKDRPYHFYGGATDKSQHTGSVEKSYGFPPTKFDGYLPGSSKPSGPATFDVPVGSVNKVPTSNDIGNNWDKTILERRRPASHNQIHKQGFDFTLPVPVPLRPYEGINTHKTHHNFESSYNLEEKPYHHSEVGHHGEGGQNPWRKIIKFLTTFIPIGLLISALTPTVITVTSVNGTTSRSRAEDGSSTSYPHHHHTKLIDTINDFAQMNRNGCESRILCELLLSASASKNAEQHVQNLLNTFTEDGEVYETEEMKKVFDAVKRRDCRSIACKSIKETT